MGVTASAGKSAYSASVPSFHERCSASPAMISMRSSESPLPDPLSDVLSLLEVRSFLSRRLEASGSWALRFPDYRHMKFGGIIEGARFIWIEGVTQDAQSQRHLYENLTYMKLLNRAKP